jgi:hypothetical protein
MIKQYFSKAIVALMALLFTTNAYCQTDGLGTWNVLNLKKTFSEKWSAFFEAQLRSQKLYNHFNYHEYKGGIGYNIAKQFNITVAGGQYVTYTPNGNLDTVTSSEFRFWQQFTLTNNLNRVKIEHRYRTEQRWTSAEYRNRFRYRLNILVPFNKKKIEKGALYSSVSDEIFLTNVKPYFERNRFFVGLGYVFNDHFTLQSGYLRQYDYRMTGTSTGKDYMQLSLLFSLDEEKSSRERHPSPAD